MYHFHVSYYFGKRMLGLKSAESVPVLRPPSTAAQFHVLELTQHGIARSFLFLLSMSLAPPQALSFADPILFISLWHLSWQIVWLSLVCPSVLLVQ